ncbi:MAG TPA: hypothetical protein VJ770_19205 [Stellaceae bacterium]|nr:hypothetical protein [Stellaceae bacterium]
MTERRSTYRPRRGCGPVAGHVRNWLVGRDSDGAEWAPLLDAEELPVLWEAIRDDVIAEHVRNYPGTRPRGWWAFDAPEPRRKLGGTGEPRGTSLCGLTPSGLYDDYPKPRELDNPYLKGYPTDPADPPVFESQAAYLDRHGLFLPGERRRLKAADFEPEIYSPKSN